MKTVSICILVCNFFTAKHYWSRLWSRWENLDRFQYQFSACQISTNQMAGVVELGALTS